MKQLFNFNCKKCKNCKLVDDRMFSLAFGVVGEFNCGNEKITTFENAKNNTKEIYCENYKENKDE